MKKMTAVYESPSQRDIGSIKKFINQGVPVWIVEPFHAYHHYKGARFFPPPIPDSIMGLIDKGEITLLTADQINAKEITLLAADKAVSVIESVLGEYRIENEELFDFVSITLKHSDSENAFKINLCDRLAEFYSLNIMIQRIDGFLKKEAVVFSTGTNVCSYQHLASLLKKSGQDHFDHPHITFPSSDYAGSVIENIKENAVLISRLAAQTLASGLLNPFSRPGTGNKEKYLCGVSIISPRRQLISNQRGPDFIIDSNKIQAKDIVYIPIVDLTRDQKDELEKIPGSVYYPPAVGRYFSNFSDWGKLLWLAVKRGLLRDHEEVKTASNVLFNFFRWSHVLSTLTIRHFITHSDFGVSHIGRNIALNQAGVETWYFSDSMNFGANFKQWKVGYDMRHPFWSYLSYDHFVTWDEFLAQYFKSHPGTFKQPHVVGCLWSEHILNIDKKRSPENGDALAIPENAFIISAFDSTYSANGITSYAEGIAFARHLIQLADGFSDIHIFLKEKKARSTHPRLDPEAGPKLVELYDQMGSKDNITICSNHVDTSRLISNSDLTISFPFTSTTFEALSIERPAFWHDPLGYYRHTPYAETGGVTTHGYEELKQKVLEIKEAGSDSYISPLPAASPLMDPYRDGKAIDRFRQLLTSE